MKQFQWQWIGPDVELKLASASTTHVKRTLKVDVAAHRPSSAVVILEYFKKYLCK